MASASIPFSDIKYNTTPGSSWPQRVPMGRPSSDGKRRACRSNTGEIVRLVQRCERYEPLQVRNQRIVDQCGYHMLSATMHYPMTHRRDAGVRIHKIEPSKDGLDSLRMADR